MKKNYFLILLLFLISSLFIFNQNIYYSNAQSDDIKYTFESDVLYFNDTGIFPINETFNLRNSTKYTEHYNGTYSFKDESIGIEGTDISFIDIYNNNTNTYTKIKEHTNNHKKIMEIYDNNNTHYVDILNQINNESYGTIELWLNSNDSNKDYTMLFRDNGINLFGIKTDGSQFKFWYGDWTIDQLTFYSNIWFHIRIDYDCRIGGGYQGLSQYKFHVYINNILFSDYSFGNNQPFINEFISYTNDIDYGYSYYLDAIGYTWNSEYSIGNNLIPYSITNTSIKEIDKFEFAYDINGNLLPIGYDNPNTWTDIEVESNDKVNIYYDLKQENDRVVKMLYNVIGDTGLEKDFSIEKGIINISFSIEYAEFTDVSNRSFNCNIYSYDESLIVRLHLHFITGNYIKLYYWNGNDNIYLMNMSYSQFANTINRKLFNIYINEYDGICVLIYKYSTLVYEVFRFPLLENKKGLSHIKFIGNLPDQSELYLLTLDSIGVYINGTSLAIGYSFTTVPIYQEISGDWLFLNTHNLFIINAKGFFKFGIIGWSGSTGLSAWIEHNNTDIIINYWKTYQEGKIYKPQLYYLFNETQEIHINSIKIEGCILTESNNTYFLEFEYLNIDSQKNFFYIDNNTNNLHFYIDFDSTDIEYIQATFNIDDKPTTDYSISYTGYYSGYNVPYFCILYTDGNFGYYDIKYYLAKTIYILPQGIFIDKFILNVSDFNPFLENYIDIDSGFINGYLTDLYMTYFKDLEISIIIITMISGFIPLLVIFLPTIAIKSRIGKKSVIPMLIIMTLICFVCQLIPTWLFAILLLIYGLIIVITKRDDSL